VENIPDAAPPAWPREREDGELEEGEEREEGGSAAARPCEWHFFRIAQYLTLVEDPLSHSATTSQAPRNKYCIPDVPEMPAPITEWAHALANIDRSHAPRFKTPAVNPRYVMPEPALFVSPAEAGRRQLLLYHFSLMKDALIYRMADPETRAELLGSQEWRHALSGKVGKPAGRGGGKPSKSEDRSINLDDLLGPALRACGLTDYRQVLPVPEASVPRIGLNRAREIVWEVGEMGYRFELLALDRHASGIDRPEVCRNCFAGGMLMGMPIELSKKGLASLEIAERFPYLLRLAELMGSWRPTPSRFVLGIREPRDWNDAAMQELERAVTQCYTQTFYEYFGRPPVIPMRLEHEFGT
jgi:hypothetical protein